MIERFSEISKIRESIRSKRSSGETVGFVPTMGSLHEGHRKVIRESVRNNDCSVVSIFVNPTQFDTDEDAEVYPRSQQDDREVLIEENVDIAFIPDYDEIYPDGDSTQVDVDLPMTDRYEGRIRPRFFRGVAQIVSKLFNIIPANNAYFGEKDLQQYIMLNRMVEDLHFPQTIYSVPVARNEEGVAYSSRNRKFIEEDWHTAREVYEYMNEMKEKRESLSRADLRNLYWNKLEQAGINLQYLDVVSYPEFEETNFSDPSAVLILAGHIGDVRLKDNLPLNVDSICEMEKQK